MTSRVQIRIDDELYRRARERAARLGISFNEYVRRLLARELAGERREADPSLVFDLGDSGGSDVACDKDAMLGEALSRERGRRR